MTPNLLYSVVLNWYKKSCGLKFISAITNDEDFYTIVPQR